MLFRCVLVVNNTGKTCVYSLGLSTHRGIFCGLVGCWFYLSDVFTKRLNIDIHTIFNRLLGSVLHTIHTPYNNNKVLKRSSL